MTSQARPSADDADEVGHGRDRLEVGDGKLRFLDLFETQHHEDEVERVEAEVGLESVLRLDPLGIDREMQRERETNDFELNVSHRDVLAPSVCVTLAEEGELAEAFGSSRPSDRSQNDAVVLDLTASSARPAAPVQSQQSLTNAAHALNARRA